MSEPIIDYDPESERAKALTEMYEAMKPFLTRIAEAEMVERVLSRQETQPEPIHKQRTVKGKKTPTRSKGPYRYSTQREAIRESLTKEPGQTAPKVAVSLMTGGYPFTSEKPTGPVQQTLHVMEQQNEVRSEGSPKQYYLR